MSRTRKQKIVDTLDCVLDSLNEMTGVIGCYGAVIFDMGNDVQKKAIIDSVGAMDRSIQKLSEAIEELEES